MTMTSSGPAYLSAMQQHNALLVTLCHNVDMRASIFVSLVAVLLFAYAYSPMSNLVIFVLGLAFAFAFPIRIGAAMLASKSVRLGGGNLKLSQVFSMDESEELAMQMKMARGHKKAIRHNATTLKKKHRQNRDIIITSLMLLGYLMGMTALFMAIAPQSA